MSDPKLTPALRDAALRWADDDVDEADSTELREVLARAAAGEESALAELADRMAGPLAFGTAGLRGPVRAGPNGMNTAVVVRTTAGVAAWLSDEGRAGGTVVVGRDARHGSEAFATAAAAVLTAAGFDVRVLPGPLPTPVLAYAVGRLGAVAGIQVTASHNPPADNGYKLYDGSGAQIVPPADRDIEARIEAAPAARAVPREAGATVVGDELVEDYVTALAGLPSGTARQLRVVATALHGVGAVTLERALRAAGFTDVHLVAEQARPDADFPTVTFPNPEEPGATDLLLAQADDVGADLAIALDPDADRCAIGARQADGTWRMLRGDETGVLLGEHVLATTSRRDPLVATTIVSSSMLARVAEAHGARYAETLTGFKWLARAGERLVYAYEEALGLCVAPELVHDKDGVSASVLACDLAATAKANGRTLFDALDELATSYGVHLTDQVSLRIADVERRAELMASVRANPPTALAGVPVVVEDLLPDADVLRLRGGDPHGVRALLRPSGTEPKLKVYLEATEPPPGTESEESATAPTALAAARRRAAARLAALREDVTALF